MLIAIDIGNSLTNIGYFTNKGLVVQNIDTKIIKNINDIYLIINDFLSQNHIEKSCFSVIISSVVSDLATFFKNVFEGLCDKEEDTEILIVKHTMNTGLSFKINTPEELGTDRIANAVGACAIYTPPVAVIDFGTATTITVVDKDARYIGGSIMPGIGLMNEVLGRETSRLNKIVLEQPSTALGKDTSGCIGSGIFYGSAGAVERVLDEIEKETDCKFQLVVTGGYGLKMDKFIKRPHDINPDLTLQGLKILYEKNRTA